MIIIDTCYIHILASKNCHNKWVWNRMRYIYSTRMKNIKCNQYERAPSEENGPIIRTGTKICLANKWWWPNTFYFHFSWDFPELTVSHMPGNSILKNCNNFNRRNYRNPELLLFIHIVMEMDCNERKKSRIFNEPK